MSVGLASSGESGGARMAGAGSSNSLRVSSRARGLVAGGVCTKLPYWSELPSPVKDSFSLALAPGMACHCGGDHVEWPGAVAAAGTLEECASPGVRSGCAGRKKEGVRLFGPRGVRLMARDTALTYFLPAL